MKESSRTILNRIRAYECRNVTFKEADGSWPIVWDRAKGAHVWDVEGRKYIDITAAFGVMAAGHGNRRVIKAAQKQMEKLMHAMGDVHPHALKGDLARELSGMTFERWSGRSSRRIKGRTLFCNSGFEAVEAALKTARLATGKSGVIAFKDAYHGLGYGALNTTWRDHFSGHFRDQLGLFGKFVQFPSKQSELKLLEQSMVKLLKHHRIGAVLVEPIQGRGGIHVPPTGFLKLLRRFCNAHGVLLVLDEIYTGFGRTGCWFACEHEKVVPDLICLGKALTGGFPLSACVGKSVVMNRAWPEATGEAIHTSTFLGHPVGCAMALAHMREIKSRRLVQASKQKGAWLMKLLKELRRESPFEVSIRGRGLMVGMELRHANGVPAGKETIALVKRMLKRGYIMLPEGEHGNVLSFTPPLTISKEQLKRCVNVLRKEVGLIGRAAAV